MQSGKSSTTLIHIFRMKIKHTLILLLLTIFACNKSKSKQIETSTDAISKDTMQVEKPVKQSEVLKEHQNERFRNVTLEKLENNNFRVKGQTQVYEATIKWTVEDGHYVIIDGFTTATIGAPEWGDFEFTFEAKKAEENSALTLILFEESAKDGTQLHSLAISLE